MSINTGFNFGCNFGFNSAVEELAASYRPGLNALLERRQEELLMVAQAHFSLGQAVEIFADLESRVADLNKLSSGQTDCDVLQRKIQDLVGAFEVYEPSVARMRDLDKDLSALSQDEEA